MNDDYLWDGSGEPDPEVQKLEKALGRYQHKGVAPVFDAAKLARVAEPSRPLLRRLWFQLAFAAATIAVIASLVYLARLRFFSKDSGPSWDVARLEGAPKVGRQFLRNEKSEVRLKVGDTLETDNHSRASLTLDETGRVEVDADSRLRSLTNGPGHKRLSLERGTIHAVIWAPPGQFVVDTPSAVAVDLGCVYTLHVDDSGAGLLRTTMGWVGFKLNGHESFIPAGAVCKTQPKTGPGTPYFEDASSAFRDALSRFDFASLSALDRDAALSTILTEARKQDAMTLWHLLSRVNEENRGRVYDRLVALAAPPKGVTREGALRLDPAMLDTWWSSFGFGDIYLWHMYERDWPEATKKSAS